MKKNLHSNAKNLNTDVSQAMALLIGITLGSLLFGWIAYHALSLDFLRPFAIGVLIVAGIALSAVAIFVIMLLKALFEGAARATKLSLNRPIAVANEINPEIFMQLQAIQKIESIVDKHLETLARRRLVLVKIDHYGVVDGSEWNKEVQHFVDKVVRPELSYKEAELIAEKMNGIFQNAIEDRVRVRSDEIEADLSFPQDLTHAEFEKWCAKTLSQHGWSAIVTKGSGDQGADVIAEKDKIKIVLQCKLYTGVVGNKAVQEAYAAQRHYVADASAVVTNAAFSASARELASTTGVLLLHYGDLTRLDDLVIQKRSAFRQ